MTSQSSGVRPTTQLIAASLVAGILSAGALGLSACASSSSASAPPNGAPSTPATASTSTAPAAAPATAAATTAAPSATPAGQPADASEGTPGGGRGAAPPPPPPPPPPPSTMPAPVAPLVAATAPSPDPRVGLKAGWWDAGEAAWNMRMISTTPPTGKVLGATHSDLAFSGKYAIQGNYNGFEIYDISTPTKPVLVQSYLCPASQNDVSVYKNLLFMSSEATNSRVDCGFGGVPDPVSKDRVRGIRVFDITDVVNPKLVANVQTCRGSHTHTIVTQPGDSENVYIYVSGTARVRSADELPGCADGGIDDPNTARFRLEVIKVPIAAPAQAAIVSSPRIFNGLPVPPRSSERDASDAKSRAEALAARGATPGAAPGGAAGAPAAGAAGAGRGNVGPPTGPNQCHDITVYPEVGLAGGACAGLGLLLDIRDASHPVRLDAASDANMSFWHSATFSNDGKKVLFTDEWGGGGQPRCRETDPMHWGADALFTLEDGKLTFHTYYKMPAPQTENENCVAHNGSLVPIPGRDVLVQSWYQGGVSIVDFTDVDTRTRSRFSTAVRRTRSAGWARLWSAYWYNGYIYGSEIARGVDIFELVPRALTQNEIDAAKTVKVEYRNTQDQQRFVWPPSFALARAYLDQLERSKSLEPNHHGGANGVGQRGKTIRSAAQDGVDRPGVAA